MKRVFMTALFVLVALSSTFAMKAVNGRSVPEEEDMRGLGHAAAQIENLLEEAVNLMGSTEDGDDLAVDDITADDITAGDITAATVTTSGLATLEFMKYGNIVTNTTGSDTLTAAETGSIIVATKSDGATTITLPNPSAATVGLEYTIIQTADQNLVVVPTTADGNSIVADAVATSDNVSCATAGHKIGSGIRVIGISATKWAAFAMNSECPLTVEAAD